MDLKSLPSSVIYYLLGFCSFREKLHFITTAKKYRRLSSNMILDLSMLKSLPTPLTTEFLDRYYVTGLSFRFKSPEDRNYFLPTHSERILTLNLEAVTLVREYTLDLLAKCPNLHSLYIGGNIR